MASIACQQTKGEPAQSDGGASPAIGPRAFTDIADAGRRRSRGRYARHGGIASALFRTAHELDLGPTKLESLDRLERTLKADDEGIRAAMKSFRADLARAVRPGNLATDAMTADDALIDKAIAAHQATEADALDALYGLLDPSERTSLVEAIRSRQREREARDGSWMREVDGGPVDWTRRRLDKLTSDLSLEPDQAKQVASILSKSAGPPNGQALRARWTERKERLDALLAAFGGDGFEAKRLDLSVLPGKSPHEAMDRMVALLRQLLPPLHPDQRDKLASSIDQPFGWGARGRVPGDAPSRRVVDDMAFPFSEPIEDDEPPAPAP